MAASIPAGLLASPAPGCTARQPPCWLVPQPVLCQLLHQRAPQHQGLQAGPTWLARSGPDREGASAPDDGGAQLATEFGRYVAVAGVADPLANRRPTHLLPPTAVVAAQLDALQRNDWPDPDAGVRTAFLFTLPQGARDALAAIAPASVARARSWAGAEEWLTLEDFSAMLHSPPYRALLDCDSWQPASALVFPSNRYAHRAVQAVRVATSSPNPGGTGGSATSTTFTFCLEQVLQGPYKGCWMTAGLRVGDYANV